MSSDDVVTDGPTGAELDLVQSLSKELSEVYEQANTIIKTDLSYAIFVDIESSTKEVRYLYIL